MFSTHTLAYLIPQLLAMMPPSGNGSQGQQGGGLGMFLPMIIIIAIFYFLLLRPQAKKQKEHQQMLSALKRGDRVLTSGGIFGTVVGLDDSVVQLKIADKVKITVTRSSISGLANDVEIDGSKSKK